MGDRRMFHRLVVESDKFLDLPIGAQALYFHLGMQGDDDGFINGPKLIARQLKRPYKELQLLIEKGYLLDFGDVVVITHWRWANHLRNDRNKLPMYPEVARKLYINDTDVYTKTRPRKGQNLLSMKKKLVKQYDRQATAQPNRTELNRTEENLTELNITQPSRTEEAEVALPPETDSVLKFMNGKLGKGVILLTEEQMNDLLDKLGLDSFDYYVDRLSNYILKNNCKVRNHYETILKWWNEDRSVK